MIEKEKWEVMHNVAFVFVKSASVQEAILLINHSEDSHLMHRD